MLIADPLAAVFPHLAALHIVNMAVHGAMVRVEAKTQPSDTMPVAFERVADSTQPLPTVAAGCRDWQAGNGHPPAGTPVLLRYSIIEFAPEPVCRVADTGERCRP